MFRFRRFVFIFVFIIILSVFLISYIAQVLENFLENQFNNKKYNGKTRIPQIVGHYMPPIANVNFSSEFMDTNNYNPIPGEGEMGNPVVIQSKDLLVMQQLFQINRFNLLASDRISVNRSLPDVRNAICKEQKYSPDLPNTSIIIVFHNEAWSVLLRTIWSVINRSPRHLLEEILLVDDASNRSFLQSELEIYVSKLPVPTKVLRLKTREGLVAARLLGAKLAKGRVLTFLDAHCEVTNGWLEPLLHRIQENRNVAICPVIDIISDDNFSYIKSFDFHWGAFNWDMHFRWYMLGENELKKRKRDPGNSFLSPAMAGGLFSIDKNYFFEIGSYDDELKIWGGDNLEMSFRIWMCGGRIEITPCSHVGHLFRKSSPYTFPGGVNEILNKNLGRVADVWMDEWKEFFFKVNGNADSMRSGLDTSDRKSLRESLGCQPFEWYLNKIWPEHFFPARDRFFGRIQLANINRVDRQYRKYFDLMQDFRKTIYFHEQTVEEKWKQLIKFFNKKTKGINSIFSRNPNDYYCLQKSKSSNSSPHGQSFLSMCSEVYQAMNEMFVIKSNGQILTNENQCLDSFTVQSTELSDGPITTQLAKMNVCSTKASQNWVYNVNTLQLKQADFNRCLEGSSDPFENESMKLYVNECNENNKYQKWILFPVEWH